MIGFASIGCVVSIGFLAIAGGIAHGRDPGYALFRLPDHHGESCLSCHDIEQPNAPGLGVSDDARFSSHVRERFSDLSSAHLTALRNYLALVERSRLQRANSATVQMDDERLVESLKGLGYIEYQTKASYPRLSRRISLNAYSLWNRSMPGASLAESSSSPTGKVLRFADNALQGIILEPITVEEGRYRITIRAAARLREEAFRLLIVEHGNARRALVRLQRSPAAPMQATAVFSARSAGLVTLSLVPASGVNDIIDLEILREEL